MTIAHGIWLKIAATVAMLAAGISAASAQPGPWVATVARPVTIPLVRAPGTGAAQFVDITLSGFEPSRAGPVQVVVDAVMGEQHIEIGRFSIYPEKRFVAEGDAGSQRFRLRIPAGLHLGAAARLMVRLVPGRGSGEGASVAIASGRLHE